MNIIPQIKSWSQTPEQPIATQADPKEFYGIYIPNLILTILTLGFYRFWAKTRHRQYLFSNLTFLGDRFHYSGTGMELFKGFVLVFVVFILPFVIAPNLWASFNGFDEGLSLYLIQAGVFLLIYPIAVHRAYRYLLSRLSWRGVNFAMEGRSVDFFLVWIGNVIFSLMTLGLAYPHVALNPKKQLIASARFGQLYADCNAKTKPLYGKFFLSLLFTFLIIGLGGSVFNKGLDYLFLGLDEDGAMGMIFFIIQTYLAIVFTFTGYSIAWSRFRYALIKELINNSNLDGMRFNWTADYDDYFNFSVKNTFLMSATLTLAFPLVACRTLRFYSAHLQAFGVETAEKAVQQTDPALNRGEGLADTLDVGAF